MKPHFGIAVAAAWPCFMSGVLAGQDVDGNEVLVLGDTVPIDSPDTYWTPLHSCPMPCGDEPPSKWTVYPSSERFELCDKPMLFDMAIYSPIDTAVFTKVRACTVDGNEDDEEEESSRKLKRRADGACLASTAPESQKSLQLGRQGSTSDRIDVVLGALEGLQTRFDIESSCGNSVLFSWYNGTIAAIWSGAAIRKDSVSSALGGLITNIRDEGVSQSMTSQLCNDDRNSNHILGITIDTTGDLGSVQETIVAWADGECIADLDSSLSEVKIWDKADFEITLARNATSRSLEGRGLSARADCRTEKVVSGDTCPKLADRCGISPADFTKYNPGDGFCSKLQPEQRVCCSSGTLPDIAPKPDEDGNCAYVYVLPDENCSIISARFGVTNEDLEEYNKKVTWGWVGCDGLPHSINICVSEGKPPLPAEIPNAVCGPTKPNSTDPKPGQDLKDLNPCPLNACCNIFGQCGISGDFCIEKEGPTGNPGTAPKDFFGCVSSCGMDIVNDGQAPGSYGRVGYYESWNFNRDCLHLRVANANTDGTYTIIHWSFVEINTGDWTVNVVDDYNQWEDFKALPDVKKVISFGGWGYSTEPDTYDILRQAMSPANRDTFGNNVAKFLSDEGLDGVDFDWEYPGAIDIPGTPPGDEMDGVNYLKFLTAMRDKLPRGPEGKTLSIAAPASFWYLKAFPIDKMAEVLNYIVYMTYDLHGQWDVGNKHSIEGCPTGNCLRSHVNLTETYTALSMITKAGVPTYKIYVGESSYGRSFKMAEAGCDGPDCFFLGERLESPAEPGRCTGTGGYISNAEIDEIIALGEVTKQYSDAISYSDILVYNDVEWVAYLSDLKKDLRRVAWQAKNFAGTIDWAVDLQRFTDDDRWGPNGTEPSLPPGSDIEICEGSYTKLEDVPRDAADHCRNLYILQALKQNLTGSMSQYDQLIEDGYDKKFNTYAEAVSRSGNAQIENFMFSKGNDYFTCVVSEQYTCCDHCEYFQDKMNLGEKHCKFCEDYDCGWSPICGNNPGSPGCEIEVRWKDEHGPCPPDFSNRSEDPPEDGYYAQAAVTWNMRDGMRDKFFADLYLDTGIKEEDIKWKSVNRYPCIPAESDEDCRKHNHDHNFPVTDGYTKEDVLNPKDVVEDARGNLNTLGPDLTSVIEYVQKNIYPGSTYDLVDALSLPIMMIDDAVDNMQQIDDTVDKWEEDKRKNILMAFLSAVFFLVPIVGQVVGTIGTLANIGRIIVMAGVAGNIALGIHDIVDDPANAPLAIFGIILEPFALFDIAKVSRAASARRSMTPDEVKALGSKPSLKTGLIHDIQGVCMKPKSRRDIPSGSLPMSSLTGRQYDMMDGLGEWS